MKRILTSLALIAAGALAASPSFAAGESLIYYSPATLNHYQALYSLTGHGAAKTACAAKGGHLAVANSHAEMAYMQAIMNLDITQNYWLGDYARNGDYAPATETGQAFYQDPNLTYYVPGVPFPSTTFSRGVVTSSSPALYIEFTSNGQSSYALCEYEHAPL